MKIEEFLEKRKETMIKEMLYISSIWNDLDLNNNENFDYPFIESFDDLVSDLSEEMDYEDIKIIHTKIIKRLEEANEKEIKWKSKNYKRKQIKI